MASSESKPTNWQDETLSHFRGMSRLKLWAGTIGNQMLEDSADRQRANLAAEDRAAHKALWGDDMAFPEDDEMRQTIVGDQINNTTTATEKRSSILPALAAAVVGAMIPGAGVLGYVAAQYLMDKAPDVIEHKPGEDETIDLGLGRIEDLLKDSK